MLALLLPFLALATTIPPEHLVCAADADCQVIVTSCACIRNVTCLRPEDKEKGIVASINRQHAESYKESGKCTEQEKRQCATAGACASAGSWIAKCTAKKCDLEFRASR